MGLDFWSFNLLRIEYSEHRETILGLSLASMIFSIGFDLNKNNMDHGLYGL